MMGLVIILVVAVLIGVAWWWIDTRRDGQEADSFPDRVDRRYHLSRMQAAGPILARFCYL